MKFEKIWLISFIILVIIGLNLKQAQASSVQKSGKYDKKATLHEAVSKGDLGKVKNLITKANLDAVNKDGETPLHLACWSGYEEIAAWLLAKGANLNAKNNFGETPLFGACNNGNIELVKLLVSKGANLNQKDCSGRTALFMAIAKDKRDIAQLLIAKGADLFLNDVWGKTMLFAAVEQGHRELTRLLIEKGIDIHFSDNDGNVVLHEACSNGKLAVAEFLLAKGADVNVRNKAGETPLFSTCNKREEYIQVAELLLANGAEINAKNFRGDTVLNTACKLAKKSMVKFLLAKGADFKQSTNEGYTVLQYAIKYGWSDVIESLTAKGAVVENKSIINESIKITKVGCVINNDHSFVLAGEVNPEQERLYYNFSIYIDNLRENLSRINEVKVYNKYNQIWTYDLKEDVDLEEGYIGKNHPLCELFISESRSLLLLKDFKVEIITNDGSKITKFFNITEPGTFEDADVQYLYGENYRGRITPEFKPALKAGKINRVQVGKGELVIEFSVDDKRAFDGCILLLDKERRNIGITPCFREKQSGKIVSVLNNGYGLWVDNRINTYRLDLSRAVIDKGRSTADIRYIYLFLSDGKQMRDIRNSGVANCSSSKLYGISLN